MAIIMYKRGEERERERETDMEGRRGGRERVGVCRQCVFVVMLVTHCVFIALSLAPYQHQFTTAHNCFHRMNNNAFSGQ